MSKHSNGLNISFNPESEAASYLKAMAGKERADDGVPEVEPVFIRGGLPPPTNPDEYFYQSEADRQTNERAKLIPTSKETLICLGCVMFIVGIPGLFLLYLSVYSFLHAF